MALSGWVMDRFIYIVVFLLLVSMGATIFWYNGGAISYETSRIYLEASTGIATLALLFYAYSNFASKREEDTARLELAVRPILAWETESRGGKALLSYRSIKHPIYDLHVSLGLGAESLHITDRHIDVFDERLRNMHEQDITEFVRRGMGKSQQGLLSVRFTCHSEVGGRYCFVFSKEVTRGKGGYTFHHRKLVSAKYPWKAEEIDFADGE
jgi:hypothetical protein